MSEDVGRVIGTKESIEGLTRALEGAMQGGVTRLRHRVTAALGPAGQRELHRTLQRVLDTL